jgi:hypothetical protein
MVVIELPPDVFVVPKAPGIASVQVGLFRARIIHGEKLTALAFEVPAPAVVMC